jgi:glucosamine kinase
MKAEIVVGIDGGGTYTRAMVADLTGHVLAYAQTGPASPNKSDRALENVQQAIRDVVLRAGHTLENVVELVAGIAGMDSPGDQEWATRFTALPGLNCPRLQVNDAVVAHAGALQGQSGIIAISGTGSIVLGVTEEERQIRNYDFGHYAHSAARYLGYDAIYRILVGDTQAQDAELVREVCVFWNVLDIKALRSLGIEGFVPERHERIRVMGELACLVTEAAWNGSPLARSVCDSAATALGMGIRLVGSCFQEPRVPVALCGGVVRSRYMQQAMADVLARRGDRMYKIVDPAFSSAIGAVLMAMKQHGIVMTDAILSNVGSTSSSC